MEGKINLATKIPVDQKALVIFIGKSVLGSAYPGSIRHLSVDKKYPRLAVQPSLWPRRSPSIIIESKLLVCMYRDI